jgi:hypothetical protein
VFLVALAFGVSATGAGWADNASWRGQWRTALALYKKKQYEAACPLFASVAQSQPKNGAVWGDLGLCELKRNTPESLAASVHASRLAVRFGDERVRKAAYYNLGLAEVKESLPDEGCTMISAPSEAACTKTAAVCTKTWRTSGTVYQSYGGVAFLARTAAEAERLRDEFPDLDPSADAIRTGVSLYEGAENSCGSWCAGHAWQSDDSSLVMKQALACEQKQRGPLAGAIDVCVARGKRCSDILGCAEAILSHTEDSPAVAREWARLRGKCEKECTAGANSDPETTCTVVHVDACRGYAGVVCSTPKSGGGATLRAVEIELAEPESDAP